MQLSAQPAGHQMMYRQAGVLTWQIRGESGPERSPGGPMSRLGCNYMVQMLYRVTSQMGHGCKLMNLKAVEGCPPNSYGLRGCVSAK